MLLISYTSVKGARQKRFIRFRTLGTGYSEEEIKAVLEGKAKHQPYQKQPPKEQPFQLLVDIQGKMAQGKSVGYKKWATKFNLKEMSKTLLFLQEQKIGSAEELRESAAAATERYHAMGDSIKAAEARLTEIAVLKTHIMWLSCQSTPYPLSFISRIKISRLVAVSLQSSTARAISCT